MKHLPDGTLRRLVDEPLAITDSQSTHLNACKSCGARFTRIESDAHRVSAAFDMPIFSPDVSAAFSEVNARLDGVGRQRIGGRLRALRWTRPGFRYSLGSMAAAVAVITGIALTPAGSLAQSFVTIFQPTSVAAVPLTSLDVRSLAQLRHYGSIHLPDRVSSSVASTAETAGHLAGMTVLRPASVPAGVTAAPSYTVSPSASASFTFSATKARAWAQRARVRLPIMPANVDGSTIDVTVGTSVVATYGGCLSGCSTIPQLLIGQMVAPRITSTGAGLNSILNYALNLPGVTPQLATELRTVGDPTSTLPIPVPLSFAHADAVTVQGVHGEAIGDSTGIGSLVVWEKNGVVYAVGGTLPIGQVESIANALR